MLNGLSDISQLELMEWGWLYENLNALTPAVPQYKKAQCCAAEVEISICSHDAASGKQRRKRYGSSEPGTVSSCFNLTC